MKSSRHSATLAHEENKARIKATSNWKSLQHGEIQSAYQKKYGEKAPSQSVISRMKRELLEEERLEKLEVDLREVFPCLKKVCLVSEDKEDLLGQAAAKEFEKQLRERSRAVEAVGIGSGNAVAAFVDALDRTRRKLIVAPTSLVLRGTDGASRDAVWNVLKFHWQSEQGTSPRISVIPSFVRKEADAIAHLKPVRSLQEVYRAAHKADFIILGIGSVTAKSPILDVLAAHGVNDTLMSKHGVTSEVNLSLLDEDGKDITSIVFGAPDKPSQPEWKGSHPAFPALGFAALKEISEDPKRILMAIASGGHKVQPIRAALRAGLVNILVTDSRTASGVLARRV